MRMLTLRLMLMKMLIDENAYLEVDDNDDGLRDGALEEEERPLTEDAHILDDSNIDGYLPFY